LRRVRASVQSALGISTLQAAVVDQRRELDRLLHAHHETASTTKQGFELASDANHVANMAQEIARLALDDAERTPAMLDALHDHELRLLANDRLASIIRTMAWLELTEADEAQQELSVSVVTPTFNRSARLGRMVSSVLAQTHPRWELLIGDDGSDDDTPKVMEALAAGDERIRAFTLDHGGVAAARNRLLDEAKGDVVVYLDDDNLMAPGWLRAVAWFFSARPEIDVAYGARLIDVPERLWGEDHAGSTLPSIQWEPFDRRALEEGNRIDMGCLAHRRVGVDARFDERLSRLADWDLVLRLTEERPAGELPALAICYTTDAPDRLTADVDQNPEIEIVRSKLR
jgi:hypothetical protein